MVIDKCIHLIIIYRLGNTSVSERVKVLVGKCKIGQADLCLLFLTKHSVPILRDGTAGRHGRSGPEVIKLFSCSTQLSIKFEMLISVKNIKKFSFFQAQISLESIFLLINVKMPTTVGILTFISRKNFMLSGVEHEKSFITSGPGATG